MSKSKNRILAGVVGSGLEWYDFAIYGSFANIIALHFFPQTNKFNAILATFGIFALGFFMRPLGGFLFGHFGDRIGRSKVLVFTVFGMTFPTILIGLLPGYQQIGIIAPLFLLVARMIQGLMVGGEYTGALLFLAENASPHKRARIASLTMMSALGGMLIGSVIATLFTNFINADILQAWVWRIPFLFAAVLGILGYYLRRYMSESETFIQLLAQKLTVSRPAVVAFRHHWRFMLLAVGICVMTGIAQYLMFTYFPSFIEHSTHLPLKIVLLINTYGILITIAVIPLFAQLSDRFGRRPILIFSGCGFMFLSLPIFYLLSQPNFLFIILGITLYSALVGISSAPMAALYMELFPTAIRYSAIAISYNIAFAVFAGTAPALATLSVKFFQTNLAPAYLLIAASVVSLICYWFMPETAGKDLKY